MVSGPGPANWMDDPSPTDDMRSDIAFRLWLYSLRLEDVIHDRDPRPGTFEAKVYSTVQHRQRGTWDVRHPGITGR